MLQGPLRHLERCDSTNDEAARWARDPVEPAPHGAVVWAEQQDAGRGRQGRAWHAPVGENLTFSCVLRPKLMPREVPPITLCSGLAVCDAVNSLGISASIKWPNDVWVGSRKMAGILTEMTTQGSRLAAVVVGIGINVNSEAFPDELAATSIRMERGELCDRESLLRDVMARLEGWLQRYVSGGVPALSKAFEGYSILDGRQVRARVDGVIIEGMVMGLDEDGSLLLQDASGLRHRVIAGEVELARDEDARDEDARDEDARDEGSKEEGRP